MIDTLKLNITDCTISRKTPFIVEPSPFLYSENKLLCDNHLFDTVEGDKVYGRKAYLNSKFFNVDILFQKPVGSKKAEVEYSEDLIKSFGSEKRKINISGNYSLYGGTYVSVQTSLPRYNRNNNFQPLNVHEEKKCLKALQHDLSEIGIKTNLETSPISRLDSFCNIITDENFYSYSYIFDLMDLERKRKFEFADTTYLFKNGEQQLCIYEKVTEMRNKLKDETEYGFLPGNVMRIENRLMRKRKVFSSLGFSNIKELYNNYDSLKAFYREDVGKNIFSFEPDEIEILTGKTIGEEMRMCKNYYNRNWFQKYLQLHGAASLLRVSNVESLENIIDEIYEEESSSKSRVRKHRLRKLLKDAKKLLSFMKLPISRKTNRDLYNELKTKFYKLVA